MKTKPRYKYTNALWQDYKDRDPSWEPLNPCKRYGCLHMADKVLRCKDGHIREFCNTHAGLEVEPQDTTQQAANAAFGLA